MPGASELARVGQGLPYEAPSQAQRFPGTNRYPSDSEAVKVGHPVYVMPASGVGNKGCAIWLLPLQEHCGLMSALAGKVSDRYTGREVQRLGSGRLGSSSMADPVLYSRLWGTTVLIIDGRIWKRIDGLPDGRSKRQSNTIFGLDIS